MIKRIAAIIMSVLMISAIAFSASAASGINDEEQRLIDAYKDAGINGFVFNESTINQIEIYFMRDGVDITAEQTDGVISYLNEAVSYFGSTGASSLHALSNEQRQHLFEIVKNGAAVVDLTVHYDAANKLFQVYTADGELVYSDASVIKTTGADYTPAVVTFAVVLMLACAAAVAAKKKGLMQR